MIGSGRRREKRGIKSLEKSRSGENLKGEKKVEKGKTERRICMALTELCMSTWSGAPMFFIIFVEGIARFLLGKTFRISASRLSCDKNPLSRYDYDSLCSSPFFTNKHRLKCWLKVDRRFITFLKPSLEITRFRSAKRAFAFVILVSIASYGTQIDQSHGENRLHKNMCYT